MKYLRKLLGYSLSSGISLLLERWGLECHLPGPELLENFTKPPAFRARSLAKVLPDVRWDTVGTASPLCASGLYPPKCYGLGQPFSNLTCMKSEYPVEMQIVTVEPERLHLQPAPRGC